MKINLLYPLIVGLCVTAIAASAKAIIDVAVLKSENVTTKELLKEVRQDVKDIHKHILKE